MPRKPSDRDIEARLEQLRERRRAEDLRRDGGPTGDLSEKEREHIEEILSEARAEHPEALMAAEREIEREREQRAGDGPDPTRTAAFNAGAEERSDGLTEGERALFDALDPRADEREREAGDDHR